MPTAPPEHRRANLQRHSRQTSLTIESSLWVRLRWHTVASLAGVCRRRYRLSSSPPPKRRHSSEVFTQRPVEVLFSTGVRLTFCSPTQYAPMSIGRSKRWGYRMCGGFPKPFCT